MKKRIIKVYGNGQLYSGKRLKFENLENAFKKGAELQFIRTKDGKDVTNEILWKFLGWCGAKNKKAFDEKLLDKVIK